MANSLNKNLVGSIVLVKKEYMNEENQSKEKRTFLCEGGSGCQSFTIGGKIFGTWLNSKETDCIRGGWIEKIIKKVSLNKLN